MGPSFRTLVKSEDIASGLTIVGQVSRMLLAYGSQFGETR